MDPKQLFETFSLTTPVGLHVIAFRIYKNYVLMVKGRESGGLS